MRKSTPRPRPCPHCRHCAILPAARSATVYPSLIRVSTRWRCSLAHHLSFRSQRDHFVVPPSPHRPYPPQTLALPRLARSTHFDSNPFPQITQITPPSRLGQIPVAASLVLQCCPVGFVLFQFVRHESTHPAHVLDRADELSIPSRDLIDYVPSPIRNSTYWRCASPPIPVPLAERPRPP